MKTKTLTFKIIIKASQKTVFSYVSNWEKQSDWILFTTVKVLSNSNTSQDINLLAITNLGPFKLIDPMVVTEWRPDEKIVIEHTGRLILGKGVFSVRKISDDSCEFSWQEITPIPLGYFGIVGLKIMMPLIKIPFNMSLKRLKHSVESSSR